MIRSRYLYLVLYSAVMFFVANSFLNQSWPVKVLVIGGNRFFGKKLIRKLLDNAQGADQHQITLLNRQNLDDGFGTQVQRIKCDRTDSTAMRAALADKSWDLVYDQVCFEASDARAACEIFSGKTNHYIFTSSLSVYEPGEWLKEEDFDPYSFKFSKEVNSKTNYAEAKRQCEAVFFAQESFPVAAVRFTFVVGEDDYTGRLKWHVDHVKSGKPIHFPNVDAKIPLIHSDDAADVLLKIGIAQGAGPFNASSPEPIKLAQLIQLIEQSVGKKAVLTSKPEGSNHSPYGAETNWYMSIDKLKRYGIYPREIERWLPDLIGHLSNSQH